MKKLKLIFIIGIFSALPVCFSQAVLGAETSNSYDYRVLNPRLNSYSLASASGEFTVTQDDLNQGVLEFTGRLNTLDRIDKLLISEDGGITWRELNLNQNISYSFVPLPDKLCQLVLKIKTVDIQEVELKVFPNINGIIYRNIDYTKLVADTIKKIAEAYESRNLSIFNEYVSRDYLGNKTLLLEGLRFDFDMFMDISLTIYINRIVKIGNLYSTEITWDKIQVPRKTGQQQNTSGNTTIVLAMEDGRMKIKNLRGNLIWATLSVEIAQASGLSQSVVDQIRVAYNERNPVQPGAGKTEVSGGVTATNVQSGNLTLTCGTGYSQGYKFSNKQTITESATMPFTADFMQDHLLGTLLYAKSGSDGIYSFGACSLDSVAEAPASGYASSATAVQGYTYAIKTSDNNYALIHISSLGATPVPFSSSFSYKYRSDGSRSFK
ncbi:MAG: hypothetical protein WCI77_02045 [Candidatus Omnitrophota bacterium]